jgi:hypothetical protein
MQSPQESPKAKPLITALTEMIGPIEIDLGTTPIGVGLLTDHAGVIGVAAVALGFSGGLIGVPVGFTLALSGWAALNDLIYADRVAKGTTPRVRTIFDEPSTTPIASLPLPQPEDQPQWVGPVMPSQPTVQIPLNIHNHIGGKASQAQSKTASPPQSERRTIAPDLAAYPDVQQRLQVLLKAMTESGFPIESLTYSPFVWCFGLSQSGKTTFAMLLSLIRIAGGARIGYASADNAVALPWTSYSVGPRPYAHALEACTDTILNADDDSLAGWGYVFDEMLRAYQQYEIPLNDLLNAVLAKGAKTGAGIMGISQNDTSSAHGFVGADTQWRSERVLVHAIHTKNAKGKRSPTGRYGVTDDGVTTEFTIPEWMLTRLNDRGHPCPVAWFMEQFPELQARSNPPPNPSAPAPSWASPRPVSAVSDFVSPPISAVSAISESGPFSKRVSAPMETLKRRETGTFEPQVSAVSDFISPFRFGETGEKQPDQPILYGETKQKREDAITLIQRLKSSGLSQTLIVQTIWGVTAGGGKSYTEALAQYKELTDE